MRIFSLPLLTKDLIEQAQNKRTYIFRVICALMLYGVGLLQYSNLSAGGAAAGLVNLGRGKELFEQLMIVQRILILLLLPPMTCGAVTIEKEKDTLALLLLTKLSPWTIVFEKFLSRIFAMGTYQLLSLPLFAVIYGIGGVDLQTLVFSIATLITLTMIIGSYAILCSAWFRTTAAAFVMTYLMVFCSSCLYAPIREIEMAMNRPATQSLSFRMQLAEAIVPSLFVIGMGTVVSGICLFVAAKVLVPRAFIPPRNIVLELFRKADRFFNDLNQKTTGGVVLVPDRELLPLFDPIVWRETRKKSLGTFRYLFRVLMLLLTPLIFTIAAVITDSRTDFSQPFHQFPMFFWAVSVICLTIHSTAAIPSERVRQTLDVLLVVPITPKQIVRDKLSGVRRLIGILTIPFIVLVGFQAIWGSYVVHDARAGYWLELAIPLLSAVIYMPLIMWIGFQLGLRMRSQMQAILATFAVVGATCAIPEILYVLCGPFIFGGVIDLMPYRVSAHFVLLLLHWLSPVNMMFRQNQLMSNFATLQPVAPSFGDDRILQMDVSYAYLIVALHFCFYGYMCWQLRRNALMNFSRIVKRMEPNPAEPDLDLVKGPAGAHPAQPLQPLKSV